MNENILVQEFLKTHNKQMCTSVCEKDIQLYIMREHQSSAMAVNIEPQEPSGKRKHWVYCIFCKQT